MPHALAFATMFGAMLLTSLGNLAVAFSMSLGTVQRAVLMSFVLSLATALLLSLSVGTGAGLILPSEGWLGWPVLAYGCVDGWRLWRADPEDETAPHVSFWATLLLFCALSLDTVAVLTPLFAEGHGEYRLFALLGGAGAILVMAVALSGLTRNFGPYLRGRRWLDFAGPAAMVLAGLYILFDTPTDAV